MSGMRVVAIDGPSGSGKSTVARHLGPEQFGSFSLLYTLIVLILPLTDAGLNHLVSREIVARARRASAPSTGPRSRKASRTPP